MSDHTGDLSAAAKNLEAIQKAIIQHNGNCTFRILAIEMCQFELDRLGWDELRGIPFRLNEKVPRRSFNLVCEGEHGSAPEVEDPDEVPRGVAAPAPAPGELVPTGA